MQVCCLIPLITLASQATPDIPLVGNKRVTCISNVFRLRQDYWSPIQSFVLGDPSPDGSDAHLRPHRVLKERPRRLRQSEGPQETP